MLSETHAWRREVHLDQIGDVDAGNVRSSSFYGRGRIVALENEKIYQRSEFRVLRVLAKEFAIRRGAGAAVKVLVHDGDEAFVEERVALSRDLDPFTNVLLFASATFS